MMKNKPFRKIIDVSTGEETIIELTDAEIAEIAVVDAAAEADRVAREAAAEALATLKASAKAKLVAGTPLTAEEADTLVI